MTREEILKYVSDQYGTDPDYPWMSDSESAVLRHRGSKKWYGLIMNVKRKHLHLEGEGSTDVLNLKCENALIGLLLKENGFLPAYHMNKEHWISILIDSVPSEQITGLIDLSYELTK